ncbi:chemotaxis protein CheA [Pseudogemmobacter humi]|uniref:Chemotaxis protein CheA n=1 Tax=Pseudogemmobacter humi TaxID=2483812 RepID=A0A3P5XGU4_9RHOB|nr:chemotaxis protein CheA [Pseudogemmobacter humi]VDC30718.1 Chemotaxis protein CheA [Pseudogemmobacter humi]
MSTNQSIRDTFFQECEDLLEALASGLALMECAEADHEVVNAVFRAVHSIKGGAGAFGLDALVTFAHRFETVLDAIRGGGLTPGDEVMHVLLRSADHLADQVEAARDGRGMDAALTAGFLHSLDACLGGPPAEEDEDFCFSFAAVPLDLFPDPPPPDAPGDPAGWLIRFRPHPELLAHGHEPLHLIAGLADFGAPAVTPDLSAQPAFDTCDPSLPWLGWTIRLPCAQPREAIESYFDFAQGLCDLTISPLDMQTPAEPPAPPAAALPPDPAPQDASAPEAPSRAPQPAAEEEDRTPRPTLRVDLERVDRLINAVGELIINQAMIEQHVLDLSLPGDSGIIAHTEDYRLLARDLQEAVMAIRAQPVRPLFQRMSRILREAVAATGKSARLICTGEATEVDKTVIERLADPLTHMIRNAVDHGIESPAARAASGKDPEGTIRLSAAHRSGSVVITLRDDGAGFDRIRIRDKAVAGGLIAADADLSESEIDNLLFLPGFSTAGKVSNLSGRGVGLDVVRNAVAALGGRITIASDPGQGSEFTISLPLTLAVMDGMVISVSGQTMVIPTAPVIETVRPAPSDLHAAGTAERLLSVRGRFLPVIDVAQSLGFPPRDARLPPLALLVETESQSQCALIVDAVHDQRQVVIKGLDANYGAVPGVSAATVLGNGQIALILDAEALAANRLAPPPPRIPSPTETGTCHAPA